MAVEYVELGFTKGRRDFVLDHPHPGTVAHRLLTLLDGTDTAYVEPDRGVELERVATGGGLGAAEHYADLHAYLVDENQDGVRTGDGSCELAQGLRHEAGLQADVGVAHFALYLSPRHKRGHRVDHQHVHRAAADKRVGYFERLFAIVGLGNKQVSSAHAQLAGVRHVERVLGVDEGRNPTGLLHLGYCVQGQGGLARRLGAVDLDDATTRQATHAQGDVQAQRTRRHRVDVARSVVVAQPHDRALAELLVDLVECQLERLVALGSLGPLTVGRHRKPTLTALVRGLSALALRISYLPRHLSFLLTGPRGPLLYLSVSTTRFPVNPPRNHPLRRTPNPERQGSRPSR